MSRELELKFPDQHHDPYSNTVFGFWVYLLTDFILFATLFAVYAVLKKSLYGGAPAHELFHLPYNLFESVLLLLSAYIIGVGGAFAHRKETLKTVCFYLLAFTLGCVFLGLEIWEFNRFLEEGNSWKNSAFLSAYFTLVGTHAAHVFFGLLWMIVLLIPVFSNGISDVSLRRLSCMRMFWQFLNIIWVFIFTVVYLMGEIQ